MFEHQESAEVFSRISAAKAGVLRELAAGWTEREASERLQLPYATVRGQVADLKGIVGLSSVRELGRWWREHRASRLMFMAVASGVHPTEVDEVREKRTNRI